MQTSNYVSLGNYAGVRSAQLGDAGIFVKSVLLQGGLQEKSGPSIAVEVGPIWPWLLPNPELGGSAAVVVSMKWEHFAFHFNQEIRLGNTIGQAPGAQSLYLLQETGLILEGPSRWGVRPVVEGLVDYTLHAVSAQSVLLGVLWEVSDGWTLDAAGRYGSEGGEPQKDLGTSWLIQQSLTKKP